MITLILFYKYEKRNKTAGNFNTTINQIFYYGSYKTLV